MSGILNVSINKHAVHFRMDILNGNLKAIEKPGLWQLHFTAKAVYLKAQQILSVSPVFSQLLTVHCIDCYLLSKKSQNNLTVLNAKSYKGT